MLRQLRITVEGRSYDVTVEDLTDTAGSQLYPIPGSMTTTPPAESPIRAESPAVSGAATATASAPSAGPAESSGSDGEGVVASPMTGVVASLLVSVGTQVQPGDTVAIIEAMKMKTPLVTRLSGTVISLAVDVGDPVDAGQTVLTLG